MSLFRLSVCFAIAILAGLGVGSGGLLVAFLALTADISQGKAAGTNLVFFVFALASSVIVSIKNKKLTPRALLAILPTGAAGALVGSLLSLASPVKLVRVSFAAFMIAAGVATFTSSANKLARKHMQKHAEKIKRKQP